MGQKYLFNGIEGQFDLVAGEEENCLLALSTAQFNINANDVIELVDNVSGVTENNNVTFNNTTHRATLKANKTYKLQAHIHHDGSTSNTWADYQWYDVTNSTWLGIVGHVGSQDAPSDDGVNPTATAIITPSTNIEVEFRCQSVSTANQHISAQSTHATIEKISETFVNVASVEKEWTTFIPSIEATITPPALATTHKKKASYKVVGKSLHIIWSYSHILATGSTAGSGDYLFPIPAGYTIDTSKVDSASLENTYAYGTPVGNGNIMQDNAWGSLSVLVHDNTRLKLAVFNVSGFNAIKFNSSGFFIFNGNNKIIMFTAEIPIIVT